MTNMDGKEFKKIILFMANQWSKETAIKIFGKDMGTHFFNKWVGAGSKTIYDRSGNVDQQLWLPDLGTMRLFYEMTDHYINDLVQYIKDNYDG